MSEEGVERKLTTIFAADVVGYSRLMGEDEAGTLARLKSLRKELVQPRIAGGRGRIVKLMGDGLLAEFPSVVEAVRCAIDIQQDMTGREAGLPDERRIRLRRGIAYFTSGRYKDAIVDLRSIKSPINEVRGWLAASYAQAGRLDEARATLEEFLHIAEQEMTVFPGRNLSAWEVYWHGAIEYKNETQFDHLYDGLRKAGLPG